MKRILIAAGGTGGHIFPGLAIAEAITQLLPESEITFVGSFVGMEKDMIPKYGYPITLIRARGFEKELSWETLEAIKGIFECRRDAIRLLKQTNPDLVIGTGGFTCAMLLRQAAIMGFPTMIHEQNAFPGRANRMLGRYVDRVAISFDAAGKYFPEKKTVMTGNPVRQVFKNIDHRQARKQLGLKDGQKLVLATGGSQGAGSINQAMLGYMTAAFKNPERFFIHLTGEDQYEDIVRQAAEKGIDSKTENVRILSFSSEMPLLLGAADLVISRAGAMSVSELAAAHVPAILVPYPRAAGDHQTINAKAIVDIGGAQLIPDADLNAMVLSEMSEALLQDEERLHQMGEAAGCYGDIQADVHLAEIAAQLLKK